MFLVVAVLKTQSFIFDLSWARSGEDRRRVSSGQTSYLKLRLTEVRLSLRVKHRIIIMQWFYSAACVTEVCVCRGDNGSVSFLSSL